HLSILKTQGKETQVLRRLAASAKVFQGRDLIKCDKARMLFNKGKGQMQDCENLEKQDKLPAILFGAKQTLYKQPEKKPLEMDQGHQRAASVGRLAVIDPLVKGRGSDQKLRGSVNPKARTGHVRRARRFYSSQELTMLGKQAMKGRGELGGSNTYDGAGS
ncbi:hypothetical protein COB21_03990, partial [Candidatus Aerophobetes bacterium]